MITLTIPLDNPPIQFTARTNTFLLLHKVLMHSNAIPLQRVFSFSSLFSLHFKLVCTTCALLYSKGAGNVRKV
jgi:hypothetical protein